MKSGTQLAPKTSEVITAKRTGAVSTAPRRTRRLRSAISARRAAASVSPPSSGACAVVFEELIAGVGDRLPQPLDRRPAGVIVDRDPLGPHVDRGAINAGQLEQGPLDRRNAGGAADPTGTQRQVRLGRLADLAARADSHRLGYLFPRPSRSPRHRCRFLRAPSGSTRSVPWTMLMPQAKPNSPLRSGVNSTRGAGERGERAAHPEVGEDDAGGAVAGLLSIEDEAQRHALTGADQVRRVAALAR